MFRATLTVAAALAAGSAIAFTTSAFSAQTWSAANSFSAAASFCAGATETVEAVADTYVNAALLAGNDGTATTMFVRSDVLGDRRALVRFNLPAAPPHCTVTGATLRLHASAATSARTLEVYRAASAWSETGVTWSTSPGLTGTAVTTASTTGWREWSVTAHVQAMYADSNHGFIVRDAVEGALVDAPSQTFATREASSNRPELVVTLG